jgi:hypothetical protein
MEINPKLVKGLPMMNCMHLLFTTGLDTTEKAVILYMGGLAIEKIEDFWHKS